MTDFTLAQMRNRVLEKLGVLIAGETAEAEDVTTVETVIANVNEQLRDDEICYWDDSGTPLALVETLGFYYGCFLANDYMSPQNAAAFKSDPLTGIEACKRELRSLTATRKRISTPARGTYF